MGQKDLQHGEYFDSSIRFADVYNGILFGGKSVIKPEELCFILKMNKRPYERGTPSVRSFDYVLAL